MVMSVPEPAPATRPGGARSVGVRVVLGALALLLAAAPLAATVWTRSNLPVRIPKGTKVALDGASYATRDWSVALTALEVRDGARSADGVLATSWLFHYTNTDREPHFVSVTVRCLDNHRKERTRFTAKSTLQANRPDGATLEIQARIPEAEWKASVVARVVIDFLSSPEG
jgi:hypothetical protein